MADEKRPSPSSHVAGHHANPDDVTFSGASPLVARQIHLRAVHEGMTDAQYQEKHWRNWLRLADPE